MGDGTDARELAVPKKLFFFIGMRSEERRIVYMFSRTRLGKGGSSQGWKIPD